MCDVINTGSFSYCCCCCFEHVAVIVIFILEWTILSVESQKDVNAVKRCSVENQKGTITVQGLWPYRPSDSQWNITEHH